VKFLFNSLWFYSLVPIWVPVLLFFIFYSVPVDFYGSLLVLPLMVTVAFILVSCLYPISFQLEQSITKMREQERYRLVSYAFCWLVVIFSALDIYVNGLKILTPLTYAELAPGGSHIRHISIMCWALIPISFVFIRSSFVRKIVIFYAIIFPILIVDRNRLLSSFYVLIICSIYFRPHYEDIRYQKLKAIGTFIFPILIFALLGFYRSGSEAFVVQSSGGVLQEGYLPLRNFFFNLSPVFQQILLYVTTPIFNFATVDYHEFINQDFLLSQLSPFDRSAFDSYPDSGVFVSRFNVGTEFFSWLLYAGIAMVFPVVFFMVLSFLLVARLYMIYPNIFTFLIFLRLSYEMLFMGFAPQFYMLLTLAFVLLMIFFWFFSMLLNLSAREIQEMGERSE